MAAMPKRLICLLWYMGSISEVLSFFGNLMIMCSFGHRVAAPPTVLFVPKSISTKKAGNVLRCLHEPDALLANPCVVTVQSQPSLAFLAILSCLI